MRRSFDEMFDEYNKKDGNAWGMNWRSSHYKRMNDAINIMTPVLKKPHLKVLETGCATGDMTELILKKIKDLEVYDAFDISKKAISICTEKKMDARCRWFVSDLADMQLDEKYDLIICCDVIYYLPAYQQKKCMDVFYKYLEPGGKLFLSVPYEQKEVDQLAKVRRNFIVEHEETGYLWLWIKVETVLLKCYKQMNGSVARILRKMIVNHKLMERFIWINRKVLPKKYSHLYVLLGKD